MDSSIHEWTTRDRCAVCGGREFEEIFCFGNYPIFLGCVTTPREDDVIGEMRWVGCRDCGAAQIHRLAPLSLLYGVAHSDAPGGLWQRHVEAFSAFIRDHGGRRVIEVGGGNGHLAEHAAAVTDCEFWTILEPSAQKFTFSDPRIRHERNWLLPGYRPKQPVDTVVFSHVLEHLYEPAQALATLFEILPLHGRVLVSFPDMRAMLAAGSLNTLNMEHSYYVDETGIEFLANAQGFELVHRQHWGDGHSIFLALEKRPGIVATNPRRFEHNKAFLTGFVRQVRADADAVAARIAGHPGPVYLCPASVFAQNFLALGFDQSLIAGLLDNSPLRIGRRLYGTDLFVHSPEILRDIDDALVIMRAGVYSAEITRQIVDTINSKVRFI